MFESCFNRRSTKKTDGTPRAIHLNWLPSIAEKMEVLKKLTAPKNIRSTTVTIPFLMSWHLEFFIFIISRIKIGISYSKIKLRKKWYFLVNIMGSTFARSRLWGFLQKAFFACKAKEQPQFTKSNKQRDGSSQRKSRFLQISLFVLNLFTSWKGKENIFHGEFSRKKFFSTQP